MMPPFNKLYSGFQNSVNGLRLAWKDDHSFRYLSWNVIVGIASASALTYFMERDIYFWLLLSTSLFPIIIIEAVNTSIEAVTDKASPERSALAKKAKDIGSAAVLLARIFAALCWVVRIFGPAK